MQEYRVICKKCKQSDTLAISANNNIHWKPTTFIISGRYRLDMNWGWQCGGCGNNDLVTKQEQKHIKNLQAPDPNDISKVLKNILPDKPKFGMEKI